LSARRLELIEGVTVTVEIDEHPDRAPVGIGRVERLDGEPHPRVRRAGACQIRFQLLYSLH